MMPIKSFRLLLSTCTWSCFQKTFLFTHDMAARPKKKKNQLSRSNVVNCTAGMPTPRLCLVVQWSVHWALSRTTRVLVLVRARCCALGTCRKKMRAPLLGLAKSIYYTHDVAARPKKKKNQLSRSNHDRHFHQLLVVEVVPSLTH